MLSDRGICKSRYVHRYPISSSATITWASHLDSHAFQCCGVAIAVGVAMALSTATTCSSRSTQDLILRREPLIMQPAYTTYEVDDLLLGYFEDFAMLQQQGIVSTNMTYDMFSYYIERT